MKSLPHDAAESALEFDPEAAQTALGSWLGRRSRAASQRQAAAIESMLRKPLAASRAFLDAFVSALAARLDAILHLAGRAESGAANPEQWEEWRRCAQSLAEFVQSGPPHDLEELLLTAVDEENRVVLACASQSLRDAAQAALGQGALAQHIAELAEEDSHCWSGFPFPPCQGRSLDVRDYFAKESVVDSAAPRSEAPQPQEPATERSDPALDELMELLIEESDPDAAALAGRLQTLAAGARSRGSDEAAVREAFDCLLAVDGKLAQPGGRTAWLVAAQSALREFVREKGCYEILDRQLLGRPLASCSALADAVGLIESPHPPHHVARIVQPGYARTLPGAGQEVLRRAQVLVSK